MRNIIYLFLLLGVTFNSLQASSQNKEDYLSSAYASFEKGEYDNAQKALNVYVGVFYGDASDLVYKIQQCITFKNKAEDAIAKQQITDAINYYRRILSINPNDPNIQNKINKLQTIINNTPKANQAESKHLQIGDKIDGYSICYINETKTSGWVIRIDNHKGTWPNQQPRSSAWRIPSLDECKIIYKNRFKIGLNKAYWTSTQSKKVANLKFYYIFDFGTGKEKSTDMYKGYPVIYIRNF